MGVIINGKDIAEYGVLTDYSVGAPKIETRSYSVPGRTGNIDATNALTGYPVYKNRIISLMITAYGKSLVGYQELYDDIYAKFHGKRGKLIFPFDEGYSYEGLITISHSQEDVKHSKVIFSIDADPFALKRSLTEIIANVEITQDVALTGSEYPAKLTIDASEAATIEWPSYGIIAVPKGSSVISYPKLLAGDTVLTIKGTSVVKISYQEGKI